MIKLFISPVYMATFLKSVYKAMTTISCRSTEKAVNENNFKIVIFVLERYQSEKTFLFLLDSLENEYVLRLALRVNSFVKWSERKLKINSHCEGNTVFMLTAFEYRQQCNQRFEDSLSRNSLAFKFRKSVTEILNLFSSK